MAEITDYLGSLEEQPSGNTDAKNLPDPEEKELDQLADDSAHRASETASRYDRDHDIFTK
jgi:hypothetical protein